MSRERALNQIVTLKLLAEDQRATEGERQAARDTMAKLRSKYDIPETTHQTGQRPKTGSPYDWSDTKSAKWFEDMVRDADKKNRERARKLREERERAQRDWEARHANTDDMGVPLTPEDLEEARRDPLAWAAKQDKRTHNQKQQDMNNAMGYQQRARRDNPIAHQCEPMATFFDQGGIARRRNGESVNCKMCDFSLYPGDGGWAAEVGGFVCTDKVPGPRKKKERQED